jgi:cytochrome c-type biogenesis protein CcmH
MPVAVLRAKVKDLPLTFRLDDSLAMAPTMKLSGQKEVVVAARVSKSGNAIAQPGDLAGQSAPVAPGAHDLSIVIGDVVRKP